MKRQARRAKPVAPKSNAYRALAAALMPALMTVVLQPAAAQSAPAPLDAKTVEELPEVVITAQRRSENLEKAGLAVSAVSADMLTRASITQPGQLSTVVPSLEVQPTGGNGNSFYVRGVGSLGGNSFAENAIGVNLDGIFIGRPTGFAGLLFDLDHVEVVKGPQGTLYGRNATGGAINVLSKLPVLGQTSADLTIGYGNYNSRQAEGGVSLPVSDTMAIRVAGNYVAHDGYLTEGYDDQDDYAFRASLVWQPSEVISETLVADYSHQGGKGPGSVLQPATTGADPYTPPVSARISGADPASVAALTARYSALVKSGTILPPMTDGFTDASSGGVSSNLKADLGYGDVTLLAGYRKSDPTFLSYRPGFQANQTEHTEQESVELRFASPDTYQFRYLTGLYYFHQSEQYTFQFTQGNAVGTDSYGTLGTDSYAAFTQDSYSITPDLRLIAGLRYTDEQKSENGEFKSAGALNQSSVPFLPLSGDKGFYNVTFKAGVEYDLAPRSLLYATVATGFKSGGFYAAPGNPTFAPEKLTAYTIGTKNRLFSNKVELNLELFDWRYHDQQINYVGPVPNGSGLYVSGGVTANVGQANMSGADAEAKYNFTSSDHLTADVQLLHAKYNSFVYNAFSGNGQPLVTSCLSSVNSALHGATPAVVYTLNCSGKPAINSPKISATLGYDHFFDLANGMTLDAGVSTKLESSRYLAVDYLAGERQAGFTMTNLSLTLGAEDDRWSLMGYVDNLENAVVANQASLRPIANSVYLGLMAPRTYGGRFSYHF